MIYLERQTRLLWDATPNDAHKRAYASYLLGTQHYNAPYSEKELTRLGYPLPPVACSELHGYFRTSQKLCQDLARPWIESQLNSIVHLSLLKVKLITLSTADSKRILTLYCSATNVLSCNLKQLQNESWLRAQLGNNRVVRFTPNNTLDVVLLWQAQYIRGSYQFKALEKSLKSHLCEAGASPDRLSLIALNARLPFDKMQINEICQSYAIREWTSNISTEIGNYDLSSSPACLLYRDAIIRWHKLLFIGKQGEERLRFAKVFLSQQVIPWMSGTPTLVSWSKAYQNMCEIAMMCIEAFPHHFENVNLSNTLLAPINKFLGNVRANVGLFSYAMTAFSHIVSLLIERYSCPKIACLSRGYFEMLGLLEKSRGVDKLKLEKVRSLEDLKQTPDILIADIHPNSANSDLLFTNDVEGWVVEHLKAGGHLILVLDVTLNHLKDNDIQQALDRFQEYLETGQLELFLVQSLAKLVQLGADNYSGGAAIHITKNPCSFPKPMRSKETYFALLLTEFDKLIGCYFELVRKNTRSMYDNLFTAFLRIENRFLFVGDKGYRNENESVTLLTNDSDKQRFSFAAMNVTLSGDSNSVYVALHFNPLFKLENFSSLLRELLLDIAALRGLPITGRQSFGFALSNLCQTLNTIRFSIGVEDESLLEKYVQLLYDFNLALSIYAGEVKEGFNMDFFKKTLLELNQRGQWAFENVSDYTEGEDLKGNICLVPTRTGRVVYKSKNHSLELQPKEGKVEQLSCETDFRECLAYYRLTNTYPTVIDSTVESPFKGEYRFSSNPIVYTDGEIAAEFSDDQFTLWVRGKKHESSQVFVHVSEMGRAAVRVDRLKKGMLYNLVSRCANERMQVQNFDQSGALLLSFPGLRDRLPYLETIALHYRRRGLGSAVSFINNLIPDALPFTDNYHFNHLSPQEPQKASHESLLRALSAMGQYLSTQLKQEDIPTLFEIKHEKYRNTILEEILRLTLRSAIDPQKTLSDAQAKILIELFSKEGFPTLVAEWDDFWWKIDSYSGNIQRLAPYGDVLLPIIKRAQFPQSVNLIDACNHQFAPSLKRFAERVGGLLLSHISALEKGLPECIGKKTDFRSLMKLWTSYPMDPSLRSALATSVDKLPAETKSAWIERGCKYRPRDYYTINACYMGEPDEIIFEESERDMMKSFFEITGLSALLTTPEARSEWEILEGDIHPKDL